MIQVQISGSNLEFKSWVQISIPAGIHNCNGVPWSVQIMPEMEPITLKRGMADELEDKDDRYISLNIQMQIQMLFHSLDNLDMNTFQK